MILTVELADPSGCWSHRTQRQGRGRTHRRTEGFNARGAAIREINTGIMAMPTARLRSGLRLSKRNNAQRSRRYRPTSSGMAVAEGLPIHTAKPKPRVGSAGVNSKRQLAEPSVAQRNAAEQLMEAGVRLATRRASTRAANSSGATPHRQQLGVSRSSHEADGTKWPQPVIRNARIGAGNEAAAFTHTSTMRRRRPRRRRSLYRASASGDPAGDEVHVGNFVEIKRARSPRI